MTHRIREAVILITFSSARVHWRATFDLRCVFHRPKRGNRANIGAKEMTKLINISKLGKPTAVLVASAALMSSPATAKRPPSKQQRAKHRPPSLRDQRSASQRKRVTRYQKERDGGKKKGCRKIIVPTAECGVSSKNRSGLAAGSEPFLRTETGRRYSVATFLVSAVPVSP